MRTCKGRFTWYNFVACDKLTKGLQQELFRVNQTYNSLTTVVYVTKNVQWAIPENIHAIPWMAFRISEGEGGFTIMEF